MMKKRMNKTLAILLTVVLGVAPLGLFSLTPIMAFATAVGAGEDGNTGQNADDQEGLEGQEAPEEDNAAHSEVDGIGPRANTYEDPADGIYVSPDGNDATADGSIDLPYKSINTALDNASAGSTIILREGTYQEGRNVRVREPNITIKSAMGEWAVIDLTVYDAGNDEDSGVYFDVESSGGRLQCVEVIGGFYAVCMETTWDWGIEYYPTRYGASDIIIEDCKLHDSKNDVVKVKPNCKNVTIRYNEIYNSGRSYVDYDDFETGERNAEGIDNVNGEGMHVHNNYIHDICSNAVYAKGGAIGVLIEDNRVERTYGAGILLGFDTSPEFFSIDVNPLYYENIGGTIRNNLIIDTGWEGIGLYASKDAQVYNNTVINAIGYGTGLYHSPIYFGIATQDWDNPEGCPANVNSDIHHNIVWQPATFYGWIIDVRYAEGVYSWGISGLDGSPTMDYNCYYVASNGPLFNDNRPNSMLNGAGLAGWQAHIGGDYNSYDWTDPLLDDDYVATNPDCAEMGILCPLPLGTAIAPSGEEAGTRPSGGGSGTGTSGGNGTTPSGGGTGTEIIGDIPLLLTLDITHSYDIYYRAYVQGTGWTGWVKNGEVLAGVGNINSMETVQIAIVPKGGAAPEL